MATQSILPRIKMKTEAGLYQQLKAAAQRSKTRNLILTRIENSVGRGLPDLMICDERGAFHFVELKFCKANAVNLSPHQVAWLTKHKHSSSWILVKQQSKATSVPKLFLYHARQAIDVKTDGLKTEAIFVSEKKFDWDSVFNLISPT